MTPDSILKDAEAHMVKSVDYVKSELRGIRTGRASTSLVEFIKIEAYGSLQDLKNLASVSTPESTQLLIKPFDPSIVNDIKKGLEAADLGLNPTVDAKQIRINVPPLSGDRRKQLVAQVKKMGEEAKVAVRNSRRDANKHADQLTKEGSYSEDEIKVLKDEIQELLKKYEGVIDDAVKHKGEEVMEV